MSLKEVFTKVKSHWIKFGLCWLYNNTHKDYTWNDFTYNINKYDFTYMFLFTPISKVTYK